MSLVLVLTEHRENRRLLEHSLVARHDVVAPSLDSDCPQDLLKSDFDLGIIDGVVLSRFRDVLASRKEEDAAFLPYLLVSSRKDVSLYTAHLWKLIDEVLLTPVEKIELHARVEILLRARRYSVESEDRYSVLAENSPTAIVIEQHGQIVYSNRLCEQLRQRIGSPSDQLLLEILNPEKLAAGSVEDAAGDDGRFEPVEVEVPHDQESSWLEVRSARHIYHSRPATLIIFTDITARKEQQRELILARDEAEEMSRMKTTFLTNMSHEIRTPLTGIIGYSELLGDEITGEHQPMVQAIYSSGRRLLETLNSVLDLAQLEAGSFSIRSAKFDVSASIREAAALFAQQAASKGLYLSVESREEPLLLTSDRAVLLRILNNLLSNAVKFTDRGGITVSASYHGGSCAISVQDTGVGMSREYIPHLFQDFHQESTGMSRNYEGNGLGLSITKRLVDLLGGTIDVVSEVDHGSTFTITIPDSTLEPAREPS